MKKKDYQLINDTEKNQYIFKVEGEEARIFYEVKGDKIYFNYVAVPFSLSGKGVGTQLVLAAKIDAEFNNLTVVPVCGFAKFVLQNNSQ